MLRVGKVLLGIAAGVGTAGAQMHYVKKPETVVRAVGVYEWTGDLAKPTASRLVPVTIFIDGKLEDAGVYLARPIPMALETGTVFELDKAGVPAGTLDLSFARHLQPVDATASMTYDDGWFGYGKVTPVAAPKPAVAAAKVRQSKAVLQVNGKPAEMTTTETAADKTAAETAKVADPDRPTMRRRDDSSATAPTAGTGAGTPDADPDRPVLKRKDASPASDPEKDADRPTMRRRDDSTDGASASTGKDASASTGKDASASTGKNEPSDDAERPTLKKRSPAEQKAARKEHDEASVTGVGSLNDDPNRPVLHRGKPAGSLTEDDLPRLSGVPPDLKQMVAVSDAVTRPAHVFTRGWESDTEREMVLGKMRDLARAWLAAYGASGSAAPSLAKTVAVRRPAPRAKGTAAAALQEEDLRGYVLSYGGAPTYTFTAASPGPGAVRYVTVVAQAEPSGELKVAMDSVTDAGHLNRTPRLRPIDAVDVEASNRASLLFEMRGQDARWFALYRVISGQAQQVFTTGSTQ